MLYNKPKANHFWEVPFVVFLTLCVLSSSRVDCQEVTSSKSFPITTLINAKWEQTPLHLEIAEYLADENANLYWDFLKDITELETTLSSYGKLLKLIKLEKSMYLRYYILIELIY